jgi:mono/diheme cytochrome c family protein
MREWGQCFNMSAAIRIACAFIVNLLIARSGVAGDKQPSFQRDHAIVPAFERFFAQGATERNHGGGLLLEELHCTSCHAPRGVPVVKKSAPILDHVGSRVKHGYLRKFLANPQQAKPGTTMPDVLASLAKEERAAAVEALVHLLAATGAPALERPDRKQIGVGRDLYHKVGCAACHETRDAAANIEKTLPTSVPIAKAKYTAASLKRFLENPLAARPAGRMPGLLNAKEAHAVAHYLLQDATPAAVVFNMSYAYYEGTWDKLPDFARFKPVDEGKAADFDVHVGRRDSAMAIKFEGYLKIDREAQYKFWLTSDDGSKLWIDDKLVVSNDGIHAPSTVTNSAFLMKGMHKITAAVFNAGGGVELGIDIQGGGLAKQPLSSLIFLTPSAEVAPPPAKGQADDVYLTPDSSLVEKGKALFASLGCASCHQLKDGAAAIAATNAAPALASLRAEGGCLSAAPRGPAPRFALSAPQRAQLAAALKTPPPATADPKELIARTLTAFNCYACHERDKIGGPEEARNKSFTTVQPEMGDEGRVPPALDGVGAKLRPEYLRKILDQGSHDRPYMHTRMPRFGDANVGRLVKLFADTDRVEAAAPVDFSQSRAKVKADGRHLVGAQAFGCIKCHTFNGHKAEGVQGIDMTLMPARLRRDWFVHYLLDPNKFRPGTRMPAAWPKGEVLLTKILDGKAVNQIEGIWLYLSDGSKAALPVGMKKQSIPLVPSGEAIIYRGFIDGGGTRAIGVGFPEKVHLCFDANNLRLAMIWQGAFLDAARHWTDRGAGFEPPLGDNVLHLPPGVSFATLDNDAAAWPTKSAQELGYRFKGYRLSKDQRPTFLYQVSGAEVEDAPDGVVIDNAPSIRRTFTLRGRAPGLHYRAVVADKIEPLADGWYRINNEWRMRIEASAAPRLRSSGGNMELIVPVGIMSGDAKIVQEYVW